MQGRIVVKVIKEEDTTKSGFYLTETDKEKDLVKGKVVRCGSFVDGIDCSSVTEGSIVLYVKWAASNIESGDESYNLIRYEDVVAVME